MKDFHKFGKSNISVSEMEAERARLRERIQKTEEKLSLKKEQAPKKPLKPSALHLGDSVRVLSLNLEGSVSSLPDAREIFSCRWVFCVLRSIFPIWSL